ncbi:DUF349 domain-containing protein [Mongoliitalea daihaiensis]|uniref:DUF349 domain-containing protein n=1 Tax=Mongoliitalea daihaiensis TaxID=2782006 RepID=UPI001F2A3C87|nr:DUF349 domain-containing protein [Mongoliitalea daihaiensis]UJP64091.1 DUF349 domain-containing protein [Mongoliitalea daihaiensis]
MDKEKEMPEEGKVTPAASTVEGNEEIKNTTEEATAESINEEVDNSQEQVNSDSAESPVEETAEVEATPESVATEEVVAESKTESSASEEDAGEEQTEDEEEDIDYSHFSKKELISALKSFVDADNILSLDKKVATIKSCFDELFSHEKQEAMDSFVAGGGEADDFSYKSQEDDKLFFATYNLYRERRTQFIKALEKQKEKNLDLKNNILDKLRELVDSEETTHSINAIKQIQDDWKKIGPVPSNINKNLWASFNALMDRFYDNRSIYFELKELDRKKNLEQKLEICEKAEALVKLEDLKDAIKALNDLHEEFKHIGPVPREEQEPLWQRFKAASDAVYDRRKEFYEDQKGKLKENLQIKEALIQKIASYKDFTASKIKEWNVKTKEVLSIQKEWEAAGPVPRELGKEVNKQFWGYFKDFFHQKNLFFKELDEIRLANKKKAEELIEKAEALVDDTKWQETTNKMISLQQEWKKIGPTPEKVRDELYKRFKKACDSFFENKRNANQQATQEYDDNLKLKEQVIANILAAAKESPSEETLEALINQYNTIGFVPRKNIKEILAKFNQAVDTYVEALGSTGESREDFVFRLNLNKLQADPNGNRALNKKEFGIRKQITDLENNIGLWKNNLEFFAASKTADKLKVQFEDKINKAEAEIEKLKKKLSIIREF